MVATSPSYPETPLVKQGTVTPQADGYQVTGNSIARIPEIDFVEQFNENINKLTEALSLTRRLSLSEGSIVRRYKWDKSKTLKGGDVPEGDLIPLSEVALKEVKPIVVGFKKYRKQVTGEAIQMYGQNTAINQTDAQLVQMIQRDLRKTFFDTLNTDATKKNQSIGVGLHGAIAEVKGELEKVFENYGGADNIIVLANPMDIAKYIGTANVSSQTAFGLTYITGFIGGVTILSFTDVPQGKIYATVPNNLILAYANVGGAVGSAFDLTSDATGLVGITHKAIPERFAYDTVAITGLQLLAEIPEGVIKMTMRDTIPAAGAGVGG